MKFLVKCSITFAKNTSVWMLIFISYQGTTLTLNPDYSRKRKAALPSPFRKGWEWVSRDFMNSPD